MHINHIKTDFTLNKFIIQVNQLDSLEVIRLYLLKILVILVNKLYKEVDIHGK